MKTTSLQSLSNAILELSKQRLECLKSVKGSCKDEFCLCLRFLCFFPKPKLDRGLPWWLRGKESTFKAGDAGLIPGSGRCLGEGNGYPLHILARKIS